MTWLGAFEAPEDTGNSAPPITARLSRLAPVHQRAALARAMRLAGVRGVDHPTLETLAAAESPIAARWRFLSRPELTQQDFRRAAEARIEMRDWRERQDRLTNRETQVRAALPEMIAQLLDSHSDQPTRELANRTEYEHGQRLATRWRPVLNVLAELLDAIHARIPDAWLSAVSEDGLRAAAETAARLGLLTTPPDLFDTPEARRARCPLNQRRKLRRRAATARQHLAAMLATVGHEGAAYADEYAVACWRERQTAARAFGERNVLTWTDDDGRPETVPLWDVMETSRRARLAALYAQTLGLDELAQRRGLIPVFVTLTLPPAHHPAPQHGAPYAGADWLEAPAPQDTDAALAATWARLRARAAGDGIALLGLRVTEPHRDGCPHGHALLYLAADAQVDALDEHLQALCPEPVRGRRIASKLVRLDRGRASPASYVMKYLLKTLPAHEDAAEHADGVERDGDPDHLAHHTEVAAWASERRLRRFAWVGLHGVRTVWQRLRSLSPAERYHAPQAVQDAADAIQSGRWADALEALGAVRADGRERVQLDYVTRQNGYGENVQRVDGLTLGDWRIPLRRREYRIVRAGTASRTPQQTQQQDSGRFTIIVSYPRASTADIVDNCAAGITGPPTAIQARYGQQNQC